MKYRNYKSLKFYMKRKSSFQFLKIITDLFFFLNLNNAKYIFDFK